MKMQLPANIRKYLSKQNLNYWKIETNIGKLYNNIIVIPAIDELINIPKLFKSLSRNSKYSLDQTLILVVVNNTNRAEERIVNENRKLLNYLNLQVRNKNSNLNVGFIDAFSDGKELPEKDGGVGFARKIGLDLALNYFDYSTNKKKLLFSLDADCTVSSNYLKSIIEEFNNNNYQTATIKFEHTLPDDPTGRSAIISYELFLRYYVLGLKYAGSQYAYNSVGSTIICDAESYIKIGGMNKRKAGEDFYFLEKLAKITKVSQINSATVFPSARESYRVPFGTGQRVKRFIEKSHKEYLVYNPESFRILKQWLAVFQSEYDFTEPQEKWLSKIIQKAQEVDSNLFNFLEDQRFEENWRKILSNTKSKSQFNKQKLFWMDGFRTLKLIHHLRDNGQKEVNTFSAINKLLNEMGIAIDFKSNLDIPDLNIQMQYLEKLRELT